MLLLPVFVVAISPFVLPSAMAGVRIAATSGPPLMLAVLSLLPGVVGNKVGYAEEGANEGEEGEEGNGGGVVVPLSLLLLELLPLPPGVVVLSVVVAVSSVVVALVL